MDPKKRQRKLVKQYRKAEECLTREDAQRIIRKADKHRRKLQEEGDQSTSESPPHFNTNQPLR